jgi:hypothetical protein
MIADYERLSGSGAPLTGYVTMQTENPSSVLPQLELEKAFFR